MVSVNFPIDKSYLVAGWLAASFWGAFTILFMFCMVTTFMQTHKRWLTTAAIVVMWSLATAHISLVLRRLIEAFIVHVNDVGATMYLANIALPLNRSKDMIYMTTIFLGDSILVWRCYMVWNKDWRVIAFPAVMVLATGISGYGAVGQYFAPDPFTTLAIRWAKGMLAVSMVTNLVLTLLTAGRIWALTRQINFSTSVQARPRMRYRAAVLIVLETGMLVTVGKVLEFVFFQLAPLDGLHGFNGLYIIMDCMPQLMGIAPTFIILAVNQGFTSPGSEAYSVNTNAHWQSRDTLSTEADRTSEKMVFAVPKPHHLTTDISGSSLGGTESFMKLDV